MHIPLLTVSSYELFERPRKKIKNSSGPNIDPWGCVGLG